LDALIVEDNDLYKDVLEIVLKENGFTVTKSRDGMEAMQLLESIPEVFYRLIIVDYNMPFMNGAQLIQNIIDKRIKFSKIIILTGLSDTSSISQLFLKHPEIKFLSKDIPISELKRKYLKI
jgi:DNA-binding response OmpR family regulator